MKEPWFWRETGLAAHVAAAALAPLGFFYDLGQRIRTATAHPAPIEAPVICVGNATLGGVGKTPFALVLHGVLKERGIEAHFLSRGHGGALTGPTRVNDLHTARDVGDEPLLLAATAPTWVAKDRAAGARAAANAGAKAIIMDDGFQNPTIRKDCALLLIDAADPAGNGRVFPAGPLREPLSRAIARADAIVLVGDDSPSVGAGACPVFRVSTDIAPTIAPRTAIAFCGIGRPARFFDGLEARGFALAGKFAFADHHEFRPTEISFLRAKAKKAGAALITTEKDLVRLAPDSREGIAVARLKMTVDDVDGLARLVTAKIGRAP